MFFPGLLWLEDLLFLGSQYSPLHQLAKATEKKVDPFLSLNPMPSFGFLKFYGKSWGISPEGESRANARFSDTNDNVIIFSRCILNYHYYFHVMDQHAMQCSLFIWQNLWQAIRNCPIHFWYNTKCHENNIGYIKRWINCEHFCEINNFGKIFTKLRENHSKTLFFLKPSKTVPSKVTKVQPQLSMIMKINERSNVG